MRKLISTINMTLDGFCNHTAVIADDELHENANELLRNADTLLFGRITYKLMESAWPPLVKKPSGNKPTDDFAVLIESMQKVVFSHQLKSVEWNNSRLATRDIAEEVLKLKKEPGKNLLVGSPSILIELMNNKLIDEYQFCVQPIVLGNGLPLFKNINVRKDLKLLRTKAHESGAITLYYCDK